MAAVIKAAGQMASTHRLPFLFDRHRHYIIVADGLCFRVARIAARIEKLTNDNSHRRVGELAIYREII